MASQPGPDKRMEPLQASTSNQPTSHRRSSSGISDDAAKQAHDFMAGSMRRMSDAQSPHSPGLNDDLVKKTHVFWDSTATRRESHSKYLPDVTLPGMTDEVVEEALEFMEGTEGEKK